MEEKPRRRWWRKKRWWAAITLWLFLAYPLAAGPSQLAAYRGLIPWRLHYGFFGPANSALQATPLRDAHVEYMLFFTDFSDDEREDIRHSIAARRNPPPPEPDRINRTHWTPPKKADP